MSDAALEYRPRPLFYSIAAVLWLLSFVAALMPLPVFEAETFFVSVLLLFSAAFFVLAVFPVSSLKAMLRAPVVQLALGFWVLAAISVAFSAVSFVSFLYFCFFSALPLTFFPVAVQGCDTPFFVICGWVLAAVLAGFAAFSVVQFFLMPEMLVRGLVHWPLANPNSLAGLLSMGFVAVVGWMLGAPKRVQSNAALVLAVLSLAALFTTGSRGASLSLIPALVVLGVFGRAHFRKHVRCLGLLGVVGVAVFVVLTFVPAGHEQVPGGVLADTLSGRMPLLWSRPSLWASAWEIFKAHPLTGTGVGTFFLYYPQARGLGDTTSAGLMAHSDPLQFASEMGVMAPMVFYGLLVLAVLRSLRALKVLDADDPRRLKILVPVCALGAMVLHAHVTFHFHVLPLLMLSGLMTGYWFVQTEAVLGTRTDEGLPHDHPVVRWVLAAPLAIFMAVFGQWQASEVLVNRSYAALMNGEIEQSIEEVNRAGQLAGTYNARAMIAAANFQLGVLQLNAPLMEKAELEGMYQTTFDLLEKAGTANPRLAQVLYHRAELLSFAGPFLPADMRPDPEEIPYLLQEALQMDPLHIASRVMLANLALRRGEKQAALDILKAGLPWTYRNQNPRHFLEKTVRLARELGDEDTAQRAAARLKRYGGASEEVQP